MQMADQDNYISAFGDDEEWVTTSPVVAYSQPDGEQSSLEVVPDKIYDSSLKDKAYEVSKQIVAATMPVGGVGLAGSDLDIMDKLSTLGLTTISEIGRGAYNLAADLSSFAYNKYNEVLRNETDKVDLAEEYKFPTNKDIVEFVGIKKINDEYEQHQVGYDIASGIGSVVVGGMGASAVMTKGSRVYNALKTTGISDKALGYLFADTAGASKAASDLVDYAKLMASKGVDVSKAPEFVGKIAANGWKTIKESFKLGASSEAITAALNYSNDVIYNPYRSTSQKLVEDIGLPLFVGGLAGIIGNAATRVSLNRAARTAADVKRAAMAEKFGKDFTSIADRNLLAENYANVATMDSYEIDVLKELRDKAINDLAKNPSSEVSLDDVYNAFNHDITALENNRLATVAELIPAQTDKSTKAKLAKFVTSNMEDKPNLVYGANEVRYIPATNDGLDDLVYTKQVKINKLQHKIEHAKKPENKAKYEQALDRLKTENYVVLKPDGDVIPAADYHISFRDEPDWHKKLKVTTPKEMGVSSKSVTAKVRYNDIDYTATSDVAGNLLMSDGNKSTRQILPELADMGWAVLDNQLSTAKTTLANLASKNVIKNIDLSKASFQQVAYLQALSADENFNKVFRLTNKDLSVNPEHLGEMFLDKARETLRSYMKQVAFLESKGQRPRYPISTLFEEVFNLKPRAGVDVADAIESMIGTASNREVNKLVAYSNRLNYKPSSRPALIRQTQAIDDYQKIQENVFKENSMLNQKIKDTLTGKSNADGKTYFVNEVANDLYSHPAFEMATNIEGLSSTLGRLGKAGKYLLQTTFRYADNLPLRAMSQISNELSLKVSKKINEKLKPLSDALTPIVSDSAKRVELNSFVHQMRANWRVADKLEEVAPGRYAIPLAEKERAINQRIAERQKQYFDWAIDTENLDYVPDPFDPTKPLTLSEDVANVAYKMQDLSGELYDNQAILNSALGKRNVSYRNFHVPAKDLSNKSIMVVSHRGTHEPITFVAGNTIEQARKLAQREQQLTQVATELMPLDAIKNYKTILESDAEWVNMADYSDMVRQLQSGGSTSAVRRSVGGLVDVGIDSIRDIVDSYNKQFQKEAVRTRLAAMQGQVDYAQSMLNRLSESERFQSTYQDWLDNAFGLTSATKMPSKSGVGDIYNAFDATLLKGSQLVSDFSSMLSENQRLRFIEKLEDNKPRNLHQLFKGTGDYKKFKQVFKQSDNPVEDAINFANKANLGSKLSMPKEIMAKTSSIMSMAMLRIANVGFALTNILSLPATIPGTMIALNRRVGEAFDEWQARIGLYGKGIKLSENDGTNFVRGIDLVGSMFDTLGWMFTNDAKEVNRLAKEYGYFDTSASLMNEIFVTPTQGKVGKAFNKAVDYASFMSDKSESLSRTIPFMMGYRLAEKSGLVEDPKAKLAFAKQFMDDVVGNYQSNVKPMVHKQALGIPTSLFYTYAQNYGQRLFDYVENKDLRALAVQSLTQGLVFGSQGVTGVPTIFDRLFPVDSGDSAYQRLQQEYGDDLARFFIYGVPSAMTGLDFSSKGSMADARLPIISSPKDIVAYSATLNTLQGFSETLRSMQTEQGLSRARLEEIWQNYAVSPFARHMADLHLGYVTNRAGETIIRKSDDTMWHSANLLAMKSVTESETAKQMYRNSQRELRQRAAMSDVRKNMRALQRDIFLNDGTIDGDKLLDMVVDYINAGGKAENFTKYFKDQLTVSTMPKNLNLATQLAKKGTEPALRSALGLLSLTKSSVGDELEYELPTPTTQPAEYIDAFGDDNSDWVGNY